MLMPRQSKFRKQHRGRRRGVAATGNALAYGDFALQSLSSGWVDSRQIEAARRVITHHVKRHGRVWIRIFPDKPISKKPVETRMGSGKGAVEEHVAVVKPGRVIFEISGVPPHLAQEALRLAGHKLSVATRVLSRDQELVVG
ncbi:MAG: 50S ribosomal protein L16 [Chloroflexi bacterium]|nr:50S ribosomal protein L16 [Chloroflexota bacterium]MCY3937727.1 50S ribosomal protein L16 [Chloroflexota bacterium]MCY4109224.1 50S ribosomal protein L16 [Chloroflexota bacterium]